MSVSHFATHQLPASLIAFIVLWTVSIGTSKAKELSEKASKETRAITHGVDYIFTLAWLGSLIWFLACIFYTLYLWSFS